MTDRTIWPEADQVEAIEKFREQRACLIGDSMGVGKTVTALGRDFQIREDYSVSSAGRPTLIVCEKLGLSVWAYHLHAMGVPEERIHTIDPKNRTPFSNSLNDFAEGHLSGDHYFVVHYDVLDKVPELTERRGAKGTGANRIRFLHVIADEAHLIKNRKAKRTLSLKKIACDWKTALTGTPADNRPDDVWSILNWLDKSKYSAYWQFYSKYIEYENEETYVPGKGLIGYRRMVGVKNTDKLHSEIAPIYIRRTLQEINPDMPTKKRLDPPVTVDLTPAMRKKYDQMSTIAMTEIGWGDSDFDYTLLAPARIAVLTRLQQMALATLAVDVEDWAFADPNSDMPRVVLTTPSPKLDALMSMITVQETESFVVFTQFKGMADLVESACKKAGIGVSKITGDTPGVEERRIAVEQFQSGQNRIFVGTIAAAGRTITLTRSHIACFLDRSWNPSKNAQAEDRIWRRNQTENCLIIDFVSRDTVDTERIGKIEEKAAWNNEMVTPQ